MAYESLESHPGLFYHEVKDLQVTKHMKTVRHKYLKLADYLKTEVVGDPDAMEVALDRLQESLMFAIQAMALAGGEKEVPRG